MPEGPFPIFVSWPLDSLGFGDNFTTGFQAWRRRLASGTFSHRRRLRSRAVHENPTAAHSEQRKTNNDQLLVIRCALCALRCRMPNKGAWHLLRLCFASESRGPNRLLALRPVFCLKRQSILPLWFLNQLLIGGPTLCASLN